MSGTSAASFDDVEDTDFIAIHDSTEDVQLRSYDLDGMHSPLYDS